MPTLRAIGALTTALCALLTSAPSSVNAAPTALVERQNGGSADFWMESIQRQGTVWGNENYKIFRNVKD